MHCACEGEEDGWMLWGCTCTMMGFLHTGSAFSSFGVVQLRGCTSVGCLSGACWEEREGRFVRY